MCEDWDWYSNPKPTGLKRYVELCVYEAPLCCGYGVGYDIIYEALMGSGFPVECVQTGPKSHMQLCSFYQSPPLRVFSNLQELRLTIDSHRVTGQRFEGDRYGKEGHNDIENFIGFLTTPPMITTFALAIVGLEEGFHSALFRSMQAFSLESYNGEQFEILPHFAHLELSNHSISSVDLFDFLCMRTTLRVVKLHNIRHEDLVLQDMDKHIMALVNHHDDDVLEVSECYNIGSWPSVMQHVMLEPSWLLHLSEKRGLHQSSAR